MNNKNAVQTVQNIAAVTKTTVEKHFARVLEPLADNNDTFNDHLELVLFSALAGHAAVSICNRFDANMIEYKLAQHHLARDESAAKAEGLTQLMEYIVNDECDAVIRPLQQTFSSPMLILAAMMEAARDAIKQHLAGYIRYKLDQYEEFTENDQSSKVIMDASPTEKE